MPVHREDKRALPRLRERPHTPACLRRPRNCRKSAMANRRSRKGQGSGGAAGLLRLQEAAAAGNQRINDHLAGAPVASAKPPLIAGRRRRAIRSRSPCPSHPSLNPRHITELRLNRAGLPAAALLLLNRRTGDRPIGAEDAAIAGQRAQQRTAAGAVIKELTSVRRHDLGSCGAAARTGDRRYGDNGHRSGVKKAERH